MTPTLLDNLDTAQARIRAAELDAQRPPGGVRLLPVTKSVDAGRTAELIALLRRQDQGVALAENRIPALEAKAAELQSQGIGPIEWHFVGHIQRNKARRVLRLCKVIHSVDSLRLLESLQRQAEAEDSQHEIFLQVALTGEAEKDGMDEAELLRCFEAVAQMDRLALAGLMAMGARPDERPGSRSRQRAIFARAAALAHALHRQDGSAFVRGQAELSLGMSDDLELAIAAGSNWVRVGGALFKGLGDPRPDHDKRS